MNKALFGVFAVCGALSISAAAADTIEALSQKVDDLGLKLSSLADRKNTFNPALTVFGNVLGCFSPEGADDCGNTLLLREVELDLRAAVDPFADAVVIVGFSNHGDHTHAEVEEAYITLKSGFNLKVGQFLANMGRLNRIHTHDMPWMTKPLAALNFLGEEGMKRVGFSGEFQLPTAGDDNALTLNLELLFGDKLDFATVASDMPALLTRLSWFWDLGSGHDLDVGATAYLRPVDFEKTAPVQLYGFDLNYRWRPYLLGAKRSYLLGGEMYVANHATSEGTPIGGYVFAQGQFNQNTYLGVRYSHDVNVTALDVSNCSLGAFLSYYTSEFLRVRVGYDRVANSGSLLDGSNLILAELNFIFGSHPAEPYWVNR